MALRGKILTEKNTKRVVETADRARSRVAEKLPGEFLGDPFRARAEAATRAALPPWSERCANLAVCPLTEDAATAGDLAATS
ncbi:hypothetical protein SUDANB66_06468 (plasmid) [Streptomyces sp. SudanB66_2053]